MLSMSTERDEGEEGVSGRRFFAVVCTGYATCLQPVWNKSSNQQTSLKALLDVFILIFIACHLALLIRDAAVVAFAALNLVFFVMPAKHTPTFLRSLDKRWMFPERKLLGKIW